MATTQEALDSIKQSIGLIESGKHNTLDMLHGIMSVAGSAALREVRSRFNTATPRRRGLSLSAPGVQHGDRVNPEALYRLRQDCAAMKASLSLIEEELNKRIDSIDLVFDETPGARQELAEYE